MVGLHEEWGQLLETNVHFRINEYEMFKYNYFYTYANKYIIYNFKKIYRVDQKKTGISRNMAITTLKSIRKGKKWCVLENSA